MIIKTFKIFSVCDDFDGDMQNELTAERGCGCYVEYDAYTEEWLISEGWDNDPIAVRLIELGAGNKETVLIHIDY